MGACGGKPKPKQINRDSAYADVPKDKKKNPNEKKNADSRNTQDIIAITNSAAGAAQPTPINQPQPCLSSRYEYQIPPIDNANDNSNNKDHHANGSENAENGSRIEFLISTRLTEILCTYRGDAKKLSRIYSECSIVPTYELIDRIRSEIKKYYVAQVSQSPSAGINSHISGDYETVQRVTSLIEHYLILVVDVDQTLVASLDRESLDLIAQHSLLILHIGITVLHFKAHQIIWWEYSIHPENPFDQTLLAPLEKTLSNSSEHNNTAAAQQQDLIKDVVVDYMDFLYGSVFDELKEHDDSFEAKTPTIYINNRQPSHHAVRFQERQSKQSQQQQQQMILSSQHATARSCWGENLEDSEDQEDHHAISACMNYSVDLLIRKPPQQLTSTPQKINLNNNNNHHYQQQQQQQQQDQEQYVFMKA